MTAEAESIWTRLRRRKVVQWGVAFALSTRSFTCAGLIVRIRQYANWEAF